MATCRLKILSYGLINQADPVIVQKLREFIREFWGTGVGLKQGVKLTKEQFVDNIAAFAALEKARHDKGETPMIFKMCDVLYDVVDTNRDGFLSLQEYEKSLAASGFDADTAKFVFNTINTNHDGKISREELRQHNLGFWFTPDPEYTGRFGPTYE